MVPSSLQPPLPALPPIDAGPPPDGEFDSDSEESEPEEEPPGPVDPERCMAYGPGFSGGSAGTPVKLHIRAKDSNGKDLEWGGAVVRVSLRPADAKSQTDVVEAEVVDNDNGVYTATYAVQHRGNYKLDIEINGLPIGGSPFPVYFSAPAPASASELGSSAGGSGNAAAAHSPADGGPKKPSLGSIPANMLATAAATMVPSEAAYRTVIVDNVSPAVTSEQLEKLFAFAGQIKKLEMPSAGQSTVSIEFASLQGATTALGLSGIMVSGKPIKVQLKQSNTPSLLGSGTPLMGAAPSLLGGTPSLLGAAAPLLPSTVPPVAANPYAAIQMQQLQALQVANTQAKSLAEQVAAIRAMAKLDPNRGPTYETDTAKRRAAMIALSSLSRRLHHESRKSRSRSRSRSRSPRKSSKRSKRSRSRSRSKERRRRSRSRSRSKERRRHSRSRSRDRKSRSSHHARDTRRTRSRSRGRDSRRSRSRSRDRGRRSRSRSADAHHSKRHRSDANSRADHKDKHSDKPRDRRSDDRHKDRRKDETTSNSKRRDEPEKGKSQTQNKSVENGGIEDAAKEKVVEHKSEERSKADRDNGMDERAVMNHDNGSASPHLVETTDDEPNSHHHDKRGDVEKPREDARRDKDTDKRDRSRKHDDHDKDRRERHSDKKSHREHKDRRSSRR